MAMDVGGAKGGLKADINVTPLVDVMLVLLIIMMLIAPMLNAGVNVKMPEAANTVPKPDEDKQVVVAIDSKNDFYVNGQPSPKGEFVDRVQKELEKNNNKKMPVLIKGDQDALYGSIMEAMDDLRKAQIEDIGLITEKKEVKKVAGGN